MPEASKDWKQVLADKKKVAGKLQKNGWSQEKWHKHVAYSVRLPNQKEAKKQFESKGSGGRVTVVLRFGVKKAKQTLRNKDTKGLVHLEGKVPLAAFGASPILKQALKTRDIVEGFLVPLVKGKPIEVDWGGKTHRITRGRLTNDANDELSLKRRDGRGQRANLDLIKGKLVSGAKRKARHEWIPRSTVEHLINESKGWPGVAKGVAWVRAMDEFRSLTREVVFKPDWVNVQQEIDKAKKKGRTTLAAHKLRLFDGHEGAVSSAGKGRSQGSAKFHQELIANVKRASKLSSGSVDACLDGVLKVISTHCWDGVLPAKIKQSGGSLVLDFGGGATLSQWADDVERAADLLRQTTIPALKSKYTY